MPPASRITDSHVCPVHGSGKVVTGSPDTLIGWRPAGRVADVIACPGAPDAIRKGSSNVLINHRMAARIGDPTVHGGVLATGDPTVIIGESPQSFVMLAAAASGKPFCEECERLRREREAAAAEEALDDEAQADEGSENAPVEAPPEPPAAPYATTEAERDLAATPGDTTPQRVAREKVIREFYEAHREDGLGQLRADQDLGVGGQPPRANAHPAGFGIDLGKPVTLVAFPPPAQAAMFVRKVGAAAGYFGNFIDPSQPPGSQTGAQLGLDDDPALRKKVVLDLPPGGGVALQTGNGPIVEGWTDPKNPSATPGGGTQWTVPNSTKESASCATCGSPRDLTGGRWVVIGGKKNGGRSNRVPPRKCSC